MSTCSVKKTRNGISSYALFILCGVLIAIGAVFTLSRPPAAFALPVHNHNFSFGQSKALDTAGVSVVRLVISYSSLQNSSIVALASTPSPTIQCTGLGVIVRSWSSPGGNAENTWVLTDGALVNSNEPACSSASTSNQLFSVHVQVFADTAYTSNSSPSLSLATISLAANSIHCSTSSCSDGAILFAFHSDNLQPFVSLAAADTPQQIGIELQDIASNIPPSPAIPNIQQAQVYLNPGQVSSDQASEMGMPILNNNGELTGVHLKNTANALTVDQLTRFLGANIPQHPSTNPQLSLNPLKTNWDTGVTDYWAGNYSGAQAAFQQVQTQGKNPDFQAAQSFASLATLKLSGAGSGSSSRSGTVSTNPGTFTFFGIPQWVLALVGLLAGLIFLILLLLLVSVKFGRARARRRALARFKADQAEAERIAEMEVKRQQQETPDTGAQANESFVDTSSLASQGNEGGRQFITPPYSDAWPVPPPPVASSENDAGVHADTSPTSPLSSLNDGGAQWSGVTEGSLDTSRAVPDLRCPHCGEHVQADIAYCPNCQYLLSPSASGLHLRAMPPSSAVEDAGSSMPPAPSMPPPLPVSPASAMSSAPTASIPIEPLEPSLQPTLVPASSISEQPTLEISSGGREMPNGQSGAGISGEPEAGQGDLEKTLPYPAQKFWGRNLSLAVGFRSDSGIKRKHKPNEDSLFAAQGASTFDSQPQQFGLFVVADGMGGHASGQDASRLAIQTMIDFVLPKVSASSEMNDDAFLNLMIQGVQSANAAVHQWNMDERADSGTTMTAALVVGAMAYIVNVGDSRTYLYREPTGLTKITHDHSVVASLVDAGIIQPDDIYTHPKRNQIYRSLGEKPVIEIDSFKVPLQAGDKLLLCSDGLWDMVRDPEIARLMRNPVPDPAQTGNALIQAALEGGGEDNVSVIVVQITEQTKRTGMTGIQLLAKPDTVTVPDLNP